MSDKQRSSAATRPLSDKQLAARRANAAKSTGPKTPQGKARSSKNALKHGLFAQTALLDFEPSEEFVALRDSYLAEYQPEGPTETHFVMEMANAQWRLRRIRGMEADLIQHLIESELDPFRFTPGQRQAEAFRRLADDSHVLLLLQRYEVIFRRQYERALRLLWEHRDRRRRHPDSAHPPQQPTLLRPRPASSSDSRDAAPNPAPSPNTKMQNEPKTPPTSSSGTPFPPPPNPSFTPAPSPAAPSPSSQPAAAARRTP